MAELGLVPPETYALLGEPVGPPVSTDITARDAQRYAQAVGDLNPIYFDEATAHAVGYRTLVVPPTFLSAAMAQGYPLDRLRSDGLWKTAGLSLRLNVERVMFGGEEWDFVEPAYVGDTITAQTRLQSIEEKQGGAGPFVLITREITYTNQLGAVVARVRQTAIAR